MSDETKLPLTGSTTGTEGATAEQDAPACPLPPTPRRLDRRSFLALAATTSIGATGFFLFATLLQALVPPARGIDGATKVGRLAVARLADLRQGQPVLVDYGDDKLFVVRTSETGAVAFDAACPHARCSLRFDKDRNQFVCPCHGGVFALDGSRLAGPPRRDMIRAVVDVADGDVVIAGLEA